MRFAGSPQVASFLNSKLDFGDAAQAGQKSNAEQRITANQADSAVEGARLYGNSLIETAGINADAQAAQAQAASDSSMFGSIMGGIGSLGAGAIGGMNKKPKVTATQASDAGTNMGGFLAGLL